MQRLLLYSLFVLSLAGFAMGQENTGGKATSAQVKEIQNKIIKMERSKVAALLKGGPFAADWFRRYYADNVDYTSGNGSYFTKAQTVDEFQTWARKLRSVHHGDYRVHVYNGDTAVLMYQGNDVMMRNGKALSGVVRTTDVYVKFPDGVWRIVVHHVTP
ncbi:MAG: YybH family protein, partial [Terriglobia bacterium]